MCVHVKSPNSKHSCWSTSSLHHNFASYSLVTQSNQDFLHFPLFINTINFFFLFKLPTIFSFGASHFRISLYFIESIKYSFCNKVIFFEKYFAQIFHGVIIQNKKSNRIYVHKWFWHTISTHIYSTTPKQLLTITSKILNSRHSSWRRTFELCIRNFSKSPKTDFTIYLRIAHGILFVVIKCKIIIKIIYSIEFNANGAQNISWRSNYFIVWTA